MSFSTETPTVPQFSIEEILTPESDSLPTIATVPLPKTKGRKRNDTFTAQVQAEVQRFVSTVADCKVYPKRGMVNQIVAWISECEDIGLIEVKDMNKLASSILALHAKLRRELLEAGLIREVEYGEPEQINAAHGLRGGAMARSDHEGE